MKKIKIVINSMVSIVDIRLLKNKLKINIENIRYIKKNLDQNNIFVIF
jgi:hypothetical protein